MKDFNEFREFMQTLDRSKIQDQIIDELNQYADEYNIPDDQFLVWHTRSFSAKFTMKVLEEYHNWLNG